ncbi:hypothetical protein [Neobacillus sp. SAB-20_R2A]|uniref:hypothetical protein n=1 Tax=Neobacillus sp. SAB-20_R2A TaxID=3120519 RepID=UPI003C6E728A
MAITPSQGQSGTTLSETVTATANYTKTFNWDISKSVLPDTWNLFRGDTGTSEYTIKVTKDTGTLGGSIEGQICVTNGGDFDTENLQIKLDLEANLNGGFTTLLTDIPVNLNGNTVIPAKKMACYDYTIDLPSDLVFPGKTYRVTANATIDNHAGHITNPPTPFGPSEKASTIMPVNPTLVNDSISVTDTNGENFPFSDSGSASYSRMFTCDDDAGTHDNTATIVFSNGESGKSASASVTVNCYELDITKTAETSYTRKYTWTIDKQVSNGESAFADSTTLTLPVGGTHLAYYKVVLNASSTDTDFHVEGDITVTNNAPIAATINDISDMLTGGIAANVDCSLSFPFVLAAGESVTCHYDADLLDMTSLVNTAQVTIQNFSYDQFGNATPLDQETSFSNTADVIFSSTPTDIVDEEVMVSDDKYGELGNVTASAVPATFTYQRDIGPYDTCQQTTDENTATFITNDTKTVGSDSATVYVNVPCQGCTLTIGYWKTHAGFTGNNPDKVTQYLPIWLGDPTVTNSKAIKITSAQQAVYYLNFSGDASNGINKLYAQLLAAKLNIANGADPSAVTAIISQADAYLATHSSADWSSLKANQKSFVNQLQTILDNYNNGLIGPGHCSESGETVPPVEVPEEPDTTPDNGGVTININIRNSRNFRININNNGDNNN